MSRLAERAAPLLSWPLAAGVVLAFCLFTLRMMAFTDGHRSAPLDDTFIHLQYAKQIARGDYFRYQPGDPPTTGATSLLYVHLLALPALLGLDGMNLLTAATGLNLLLLYFALFELHRLARALYGREAALAAIVFCLSSGVFLWGAFSQMEIALFACLLIVTARLYHQWTSSGEGFRPLMVAAALLCLVRPEGSIFALLLTACVFAQRLLRERGQEKEPWAGRWMLLLPVAAYLFQPVLNWFLTGETTSAGLLAKSEFAPSNPFWWPNVKTTWTHFQHVVLFLLGLSPEAGETLLGLRPQAPGHLLSAYLPPGTLLLFLMATVGIFSRRQWQAYLRSIRPWGVLGVVATMAAVATLYCYNDHHWRYLLPLFPLMFVGVAGGLSRIASAFRGRSALWIFRVLALLFVIAQGAHLLFWANQYGRECGIHYKKHFQLAQWIDDHLPEQARIAINDAGILPYASERRFFDLVGLTTRGTTIPFRVGYGALAEYLEQLPEEERFDYYCVFPRWFPSYQNIGLFGEELFSIDDPYTSGYEKKVYRARWDWVGSGDEPKRLSLMPGWNIRDRLDVADLASEADHDYTLLSGPAQRRPADLQANLVYHHAGEDRLDWAVVDAGRQHRGGERFQLRNLEPGHPARLILRTADISGIPGRFVATVAVNIDGAFFQQWKLSPNPWRWSEEVLSLPAHLIVRPELEMEVRFLHGEESPFYGSYYYWILQEDEAS